MRSVTYFTAAVTLVFAVLLPGAVQAKGIYDGIYQGTTSQGMHFEFEVVGDAVQGAYFCARYTCPSGAAPIVCTSVAGSFLIGPDSTYELSNQVLDWKIVNYTPFPSVLRGAFPNLFKTAGKIVAGMAAFNGTGLKTEACSFRGTFQATRNPVVMAPARAFAE